MLIKHYNSFFNSLSITKINLLIFLILTFLILISSTICLIYNSSIRNKKTAILKNLEHCQNIILKERLKRINWITKNNPQYKTIFNIWINRYKKLLKYDCQTIVKSFLQILALEQKKAYKDRNKIIKVAFNHSNKTKIQMSRLLSEIDYFISIDQLVREYQLFFKQNFNYLKSEIIKTKLQNKLNQDQLTEIIDILDIKFKELEENIKEAQITNVINILSEIALGTSTLAEILVNLPNLSHQVYHLIPKKLNLIKNQLKHHFHDDSFLLVFKKIESTINEKIATTKELINNLQYKKSKNQIKEILHILNKFNDDLQEEANFSKIFIQSYSHYLANNINLNQIFDDINKDFNDIINSNLDKVLSDQINDLKSIINQQLATLNSVESQLILENEKLEKALTYQQLLMVLSDVLENNIIVFNSLSDYNQILTKKIKPKIIIESSINKLNSMMVQIENILSNIKYFFLDEKYYKEFEALQTNLTQTIENIKELKTSQESFIEELHKYQTQVFHLYQQLKICITFYYLANSALVYANRYHQNNVELNLQFKNIEDNIMHYNYQQAVVNLINLLN